MSSHRFGLCLGALLVAAIAASMVPTAALAAEAAAEGGQALVVRVSIFVLANFVGSRAQFRNGHFPVALLRAVLGKHALRVQIQQDAVVAVDLVLPGRVGRVTSGLIEDHLDHCLEETVGPLPRERRKAIDEFKAIAKYL